MLEIIALIAMGKRIGSIMREKGRKGGWYQLLLVVLWIGGEFVGAIFGGIITNGRGGLAIYLFALIGAAVGAAIAFWIANNASSDTSALQRQMAFGSTQTPVDPNQPRILPGAQKNSWVCSVCGGYLRSDASFCKHCNVQFATVQTSNSVLQPTAPTVVPSSSVEERLARLNELQAKNLITEQELQERRQQILKDL
jgi:hypothetical protein